NVATITTVGTCLIFPRGELELRFVVRALLDSRLCVRASAISLESSENYCSTFAANQPHGHRNALVRALQVHVHTLLRHDCYGRRGSNLAGQGHKRHNVLAWCKGLKVKLASRIDSRCNCRAWITRVRGIDQTANVGALHDSIDSPRWS